MSSTWSLRKTKDLKEKVVQLKMNKITKQTYIKDIKEHKDRWALRTQINIENIAQITKPIFY